MELFPIILFPHNPEWKEWSYDEIKSLSEQLKSFRDFLRRNPSVAKEYETLKMSLLPEYRNNREGYTEAKSDFINKVIASAKRNDTD